MQEEKAFRILVVTSRPLIDAEGQQIVLLDVVDERRRIATGLKNSGIYVQVHFLPEATTGTVKEALRTQWDLIHFTGHATRDGSLVLEDSFGTAHFLMKQQVKQLLSEKQIPLAVLSACHSEIIAQELNPSSIPAVIAIDARTPIADRAATIFAEHFYSALTKGWNLNRAYLDAQEAVALDPDVGDNNPPHDMEGNPESPWSKRFKLLGKGDQFISVRVGEYQESGARIPSIQNLRERSVNFVGRSKEIVEVIKGFDLTKSRRVALIGTGGLGKTETAKAVGWWYMERGRVDAVVWASASNDEGEYKLRDLASLLTILTSVSGLQIREQIQFEEQKKLIKELFASRRVLLVLDNWETVEPKNRHELWNFILSLPDTARVLITSRDVLPAKDARNLELNALAPDDARKLFLKVAGNAGYFDRNPHLSKEEVAILGSICERLSGYPLAIEVVAGQTYSRTLSEIWTDLLNVPKLVMESKDELTGEPRGVWTSLDLSYNLLSDEEKLMFQQMGALFVPASVEDISALTMLDVPESVLDTLVRRSLVQMREGTYALLPIVRDYAKSKLMEVGYDVRELHERAAAYYTSKGSLTDLLIASEHLFEVAQKFKSKETCQKFIDHISDHFYRLVLHGHWGSARLKAAQALTLIREMGDKEQLLVWTAELANMSTRTGEYEQSVELSRQALKMAEELGDERKVAYMLHNIAVCRRSQWNYEEALQLLHKSLEITQRLGDKKAIANTLGELGAISHFKGNDAKAIEYYRQSAKICNEIGDEHGVASATHNIASALQGQRNYSEALRLYQRYLDFAQQIGEKSSVMTTLRNMGMIYEELGEYQRASELLNKSFKIAEDLGDKSSMAELLFSLGGIAQYQGDHTQMQRCYKQCFEIAKQLGDKSQMARLLHNEGLRLQHEGKLSDAAHLYQQGMKLKEEIGDRVGIARSLNQLGNIEYLQENLDTAAEFYQRSLKIREEIGDKQAIATAQAQLGALEARRGNYAEATGLCLKALAIYQAVGGKREIAQGLFQLGQIALAQEQLKEAFVYLYQAGSLFVELKHQYSEMAIHLLREISKQVGQEQVEEWTAELSNSTTSTDQPSEINSDEQAALKFMQSLANIGEAVIKAHEGDEDQKRGLVQHLTQTERVMREQGLVGVGDFLEVMRGLLIDEDVQDKINALPEGLKDLAEQTKDWLN